MIRNYEEASENYKTLVQLYPADRGGHSNLAVAYFDLRDFANALPEHVAPWRSIRRPDVPDQPRADCDVCRRFRNRCERSPGGYRANPYFPKANPPLAMKALTSATFPWRRWPSRTMEKGASGASLATMGRADIALYQGRFKEAEALLTKGIAVDEETKNTTAMAAKLLALAEVYSATGRKAGDERGGKGVKASAGRCSPGAGREDFYRRRKAP